MIGCAPNTPATAVSIWNSKYYRRPYRRIVDTLDFLLVLSVVLRLQIVSGISLGLDLGCCHISITNVVVYNEGLLTLLVVLRLWLGLGLVGATTLLGRLLTVLDVLLGTLARRRRLLGSGIAALAAVDLLLAATALLGSRRGSAAISRGHELLLEDGPGVAG